MSVWGALATAEEATWAVLDNAVEHERHFEFTVRACEAVLCRTPTAEKAATVRERLMGALAAAAEKARYKTLAECLPDATEEEEEAPPRRTRRRRARAPKSAPRESSARR